MSEEQDIGGNMTLCKAVLVFLVTSVFVASALAQDCPATVVKARPDWASNKLYLEVQNTANKDIKAVKIGVNFLDATGDESRSPKDYIFENIRVTKKKSYGFDNYLYAGASGAKAWPIKVVFTDGTVWENPNPGKECVATFHK